MTRSSGVRAMTRCDDLLGGLARDRPAALRAMRHADGGVEKAKVVVDLGDGTDGRAGAAAGGFLLDRDGRAEAVDGVDVGTLHLIKELAGIGGERLDVTALAFGVDGVKGERGFARTAEAGNHGEGITGDLYINIFEIMLARPAHRNLGNGHQRTESNSCPFVTWTGAQKCWKVGMRTST